MIRDIALLIRPLAITFVLLLSSVANAQQENNTSLTGTRITFYQRASASQCQADCANNPNCQGTTWITAGTYNRSDPAMCYLLSAVTGRTSAAGHISLVKSTGTNLGGGENGTSLTGTRITFYQRATASQCQADCANNPSCQGTTWIAPGTYNRNDPAMCYLLSAVTGRTPAAGHISSVKNGSGGGGPAAPPPPPPKAPTPPPGATAATWYTKSNASSPDGQRFSFNCPRLGTDGFQSMWGTDIYTFDSGICMAGVHVGVITRERGGVVTIEMRPGQSSYPASTRNGVSSQGYGAYNKSFAVLR